MAALPIAGTCSPLLFSGPPYLSLTGGKVPWGLGYDWLPAGPCLGLLQAPAHPTERPVGQRMKQKGSLRRMPSRTQKQETKLSQQPPRPRY